MLFNNNLHSGISGEHTPDKHIFLFEFSYIYDSMLRWWLMKFSQIGIFLLIRLAKCELFVCICDNRWKFSRPSPDKVRLEKNATKIAVGATKKIDHASGHS